MARVGAWFAVLALVCAAGLLLVQHPVGVIAVTLILGLGVTWEARRERKRLLSVAAARSGESICGFARSFDARSVDPLVIRAVYEHLQDELHSYKPHFPVRAVDRLKEDLGVDDDDLDMSVASGIACRTGRSLDDVHSNPYYGRVKTASDLVYFFNHQPEPERASQVVPGVGAQR